MPLVEQFITTFGNGCLGSHNDEERSEMRYVMRIAGPRESSKFWTHIALLGNAQEHAYLSVPEPHSAVAACQRVSASWTVIVSCVSSSLLKLTCLPLHFWLDWSEHNKRFGRCTTVCFLSWVVSSGWPTGCVDGWVCLPSGMSAPTMKVFIYESQIK